MLILLHLTLYPISISCFSLFISYGVTSESKTTYHVKRVSEFGKMNSSHRPNLFKLFHLIF